MSWYKYEGYASCDVIYFSKLLTYEEIDRVVLPTTVTDSNTAYLRGRLFRFTLVKEESEETSWSDVSWSEAQELNEDGIHEPPKTTFRYFQVDELSPDEVGKELYNSISVKRLRDLNEGVALREIKRDGFSFPRFLINHNTKCAYELVDNEGKRLLFVKRGDIDFDSLKLVDGERDIIDKYKNRDLGGSPFNNLDIYSQFKKTIYGAIDTDLLHERPFCVISTISIGEFKNGVAEMSFQVKKDRPIRLYGFINSHAQVVAKFKYVLSDNEREEMRKMAEGQVASQLEITEEQVASQTDDGRKKGFLAKLVKWLKKA